jgi:excisionase family DNA binding protein
MSVAHFLTLEEASAYLARRGILTPDGTPYNPGTIKAWCRRGDFPNAKHITLPRNHTARPVWHIPTCDLDMFTLRRDRPKPGHTTREAAAILGMSHVTIETYIRAGKIGGVKLGKDWYTTDADLEAFRQRPRVRANPNPRPKSPRIDPGPEKRCKRCGEVQPIAQFVPDDRYRDGYTSWCNACHLEYSRQPEQRAKRSQRSKSRYSNPVYRATYQAKNNARYRERWHKDPAFRRRKNAQKAMFNHGRRSQEKRGDLTPEQWQAICNHYGNRCLCCGKPEVTLDHIRPLSRGGKHTASNAQPLCVSCNSRKMTKTIDYRPDKGKGIYQQETLF